MKKIIIILICIGVLLGTISFFMADEDSGNGADEPAATQAEFPRVQETTPYPDTSQVAHVEVSTHDGGVLRTRNFLGDDDTYELSDDGIYVIGEKDDVIGDKYKIYYHDFDGSIIVSLRSQPLYTVRLLAEAELVKTIGLTEGALCDLNIIINTPLQISESYSGRNLGLSFCPGSVSLK